MVVCFGSDHCGELGHGARHPNQPRHSDLDCGSQYMNERARCSFNQVVAHHREKYLFMQMGLF